MKDDPVAWLEGHIAKGIPLREEGWELRTKEAAGAWHERELQWADELRNGIAVHSPRDVPKVDIVDKVPVLDLPAWHIWWEPSVFGMAVTSTGVDRPGNNPLSCHTKRIEVAQEIAQQWRDISPMQLDLAPETKRGGRPSDKRATEEFYRKLAVEIDERGKGESIRAKCADIATQEEVAQSSATIERETLPYRKKRGKKIPRSNFPRP